MLNTPYTMVFLGFTTLCFKCFHDLIFSPINKVVFYLNDNVELSKTFYFYEFFID